MRRHASFLAVPLVALSACQQFQARHTERFAVPADGVEAISCETHNGNVEVVGQADLDEIRVTVVKVAHGSTQAAADASLAAMEIGRAVEDGILGLRLATKRIGWSGSVSFHVVAPPRLAGRFETHNGSVGVRHLAGDSIHVETHNGDVEIDGAFATVRAESHNGGMRIKLRGDRVAEASIETHNGNVAVGLAPEVSAMIAVGTHNGSIRVEEPIALVAQRKRSVDARAGDGRGRVEIETHNGSVRVGGVDD